MACWGERAGVCLRGGCPGTGQVTEAWAAVGGGGRAVAHTQCAAREAGVRWGQPDTARRSFEGCAITTGRQVSFPGAQAGTCCWCAHPVACISSSTL